MYISIHIINYYEIGVERIVFGIIDSILVGCMYCRSLIHLKNKKINKNTYHKPVKKIIYIYKKIKLKGNIGSLYYFFA